MQENIKPTPSGEKIIDKEQKISELEQKVEDLENQNSNLDYLLNSGRNKFENQRNKRLRELEQENKVLKDQENKKEPIILLDKVEKAKELTKIQGILASNLRTRKSSNTPYMAFFRPKEANKHYCEECANAKCQECEIPVVFRLKPCEYKDCQCHTYKPQLKKGDSVILEGEFSESKKSHRPSFTCYTYRILTK